MQPERQRDQDCGERDSGGHRGSSLERPHLTRHQQQHQPAAGDRREESAEGELPLEKRVEDDEQTDRDGDADGQIGA